MQRIEVKKIDSTKRELEIEVSGERVAGKFEEIFTQIGKDAKIPGFRPGHAPRDMIEKNYSSLAHEQVLKDLVPAVYNEAIEKENLDVIELPQITDVKLERSRLSFKAAVEVSPEIKLKNYKGIQVSFKKANVSADEIKRNLDSLKEQKKIEAIDERCAKGLGYPTVAELEKAIERQMLAHKEQEERQRIEHEIIEGLIKDLDFKLPRSLVERQLQDLVRQAKVDLAYRGVAREKIEEQEKELQASLEAEAKKQVKVYLVLGEIAKKENIPVEDSMPRKVMEFLLQEAQWNIQE